VERVDKQKQKQSKNAILGVFAKQPLPGQVKTRLCPPLKAEEAMDLYLVSLSETVTRMQHGQGYDLAICYSGERSWFESTFPGITLIAQEGDDLGARMATALNSFLEQGYDQAALIGSDIPDLPLEIVEQAFDLLNCSDLVFGPAVDGGYYLVGETRHCPELFKSIPWSSDQVLSKTMKKAQALGVKTELLPQWEDLDDIASLKRHQQRNPEGSTSRFMKRQLAQYFSVG